MKKLLMVSLALLFVCNLAWAENFRLGQTADKEVTESETIEKNSGEKLYSQTTKSELGFENGRKFVRITQSGNGKTGGSKVDQKWEVVAYCWADPYIKPYHSVRKLYSKSGQLLRIDTFNFDYIAKKIYIKKEDKTSNKISHKTLTCYNDILDKYTIGLALHSYPYKQKRKVKFHYVSPDGKLFRMTMIHRGIEKMTVPKGTYTSHKLEMDINLGLLGGIVSAFIPKTYFWYSDQQPPIWLQYEGLDGSLGTPHVIMQATK